MKKSQLILMIISAGILVVISLILIKKDNKSWKRKGGIKTNLLSDSIDVNKINTLNFKDSNSSVSLEKKDGKWTVKERNNYPADFSKISTFVLKIKDLKVVDKINVGKKQLGRLQLLEPSDKEEKDKVGSILELKDKNNKLIEKIIIGKMHHRKIEDSPFGREMPDGRYVMLDSKKEPVLVSETLFGVSSKPAMWLDNDFIKIKNVKSIEFKGSDKNENCLITKENENDKFKIPELSEGKIENQQTINSVLSALKSLTFKDVYPEQIKFKKGDKVKELNSITVKTFDNFIYTIKIAEIDKKYIINIETQANIAEKRIPNKNDKKEDLAKLDKEFELNKKLLKDKLNKEKDFSKWNYEISKYTAENLLKKKSNLISNVSKKEKSVKKK